jgi:hypothetical protein
MLSPTTTRITFSTVGDFTPSVGEIVVPLATSEPIVNVPETLASPATVNNWLGLVVPMPTFPVAIKLTTDVVPVKFGLPKTAMVDVPVI